MCRCVDNCILPTCLPPSPYRKIQNRNRNTTKNYQLLVLGMLMRERGSCTDIDKEGVSEEGEWKGDRPIKHKANNSQSSSSSSCSTRPRCGPVSNFTHVVCVVNSQQQLLHRYIYSYIYSWSYVVATTMPLIIVEICSAIAAHVLIFL